MSQHAEEKKRGAPAWFVSFGDMITLILTFFILLVTLGPKQDAVNAAKTIGSFECALKSYGIRGLLTSDEKVAIFDRVRARFGLPPEDDPDRIDASIDAAQLELLRVQSIERMRGTNEIRLSNIVRFPSGSAALNEDQKRVLEDREVELAPTAGQLLVIEAYGDVHLDEASNARIALDRAQAVANHLLETQDFSRARLQLRVPSVHDPARAGQVDARLLIPIAPR